jgi:hypothetical protein
MKLRYGLILILLPPLLAGCEQLGFEDPAAEKAREEAEGKAIGSGCRQTGRVLEDCYQNNRKAPKAAIFSGWREMDAYMRENKIEEIKPESAATSPAATSPAKNDGAPKPAQEAASPSQQKGESATAKPAVEAKPAEAVPEKRARPALAR